MKHSSVMVLAGQKIPDAIGRPTTRVRLRVPKPQVALQDVHAVHDLMVPQGGHCAMTQATVSLATQFPLET
jgi:hypothetical protein